MHLKKETFLNLDSSSQMDVFPHNVPSDFHTRLPFRITDGSKMQLSVKETFYTYQDNVLHQDGKLMFVHVHIPSEEDNDFDESHGMTAPIVPLACEADKETCHYVIPYERKHCIEVINFRTIGIKIFDEQGAPFSFKTGTRIIVTVHLETMDGSLVMMI